MIAVSGGVAREGPAADRDTLGGDRHPDHHLRHLGPVILGVPPSAGRRLGRPREPVVRAGVAASSASSSALSSCQCVEVVSRKITSQARFSSVGRWYRRSPPRSRPAHRAESPFRHKAVSASSPTSHSIATRSAAHRQAANLLPGSRARCATRLKITRSTVSASSLRPAAARRLPDAQPFPEPIQHPRAAQPTRVQHLQLRTRRRRHRGRRIQEPRDRRHQPRQRHPVDRLHPAEVVDHPSRSAPRSPDAASCAPTADSAPPTRPGYAGASPADTRQPANPPPTGASSGDTRTRCLHDPAEVASINTAKPDNPTRQTEQSTQPNQACAHDLRKSGQMNPLNLAGDHAYRCSAM
jgi:hypothetical protein